MKTLISKVFLILGIILGLSAIACAQEGDNSIKAKEELRAINLKPAYKVERVKHLQLNLETDSNQKVTKKDLHRGRYARKGLEQKVSKPLKQEKIMINK